MYWSEWGTSKSIKRAEMDGSKPQQLLPTKGYANHLSLDYERRRLYWTEINPSTFEGAIMSSNLNGNDEQFIIRDRMLQPVGFTMSRDYLYWSNNVTGEVLRLPINDRDVTNSHVIHKNTYRITDLLVYQKRNRGSNQCTKSNAGCTHLCLPVPGKNSIESVKYKCACPTHYTLTNENDCEGNNILSLNVKYFLNNFFL